MRKRLPTFTLAAALLYLSAGAAASFAKEAEAGAAPHAARPVPAPTSFRKIDEYGRLSWSDERARLDNFAIEVKDYPEVVGYVVCYGGRVGREGEAVRRCTRAKNYLVGYRGLDAARVQTIDGGFREVSEVELWALPAGVTPPTGTPTVDRSGVKFVKAGPRRKHGRKRL